MIQGPPGAGKTTVIAALAHSFIRQREKVLIVAHTNVAIDFVTTRTADAGLEPVRVFGQAIEGLSDDAAQYSSRTVAEKHGISEEREIQQSDLVLPTTGCIGATASRGSRLGK
jgi:superfamily II DNA or RNA helicase